MRINNIGSKYGVYNTKNENKKNEKASNPQEKDQINISSKAVEFQFALKKVKETQEIRHDKVDEIKQRVISGNYKIDAKTIAEKMISSATSANAFSTVML